MVDETAGAAGVKALFAAVAVLGCAAGTSAEAQTSLPQIEVQRSSRSGATTASRTPAPAVEAAPAPAPTEEGPYDEVQGYLANRSATGTKTDTPLRETPQSITVVTQETIRDQGATNIQEALRYVAGVFADAYGSDTRGDYPRIRGQDPNIFLDGTQAVNAWAFNEWRPDPYTLSRVEVLRGPSSVMYGASSTAGIINMVSKRPQAESHHEIGVQYGSYDWRQAQFDSTGKLTADGQWLYRLIGVVREANYQTDYVNNDRVLIQPAITWKPTNNTTWTVLGFYQQDRAVTAQQFLPHVGTIFPGPLGFIPINRFAGEPGFDKYDTTSGSVSSLFEHAFSENFKIRQNMRYLHTNGVYNSTYPDWSTYNPNTGTINRWIWMNAPIRDSVTSDTNAEIKFNTGVVQHKVLAGFDYRALRDHGRQNFGFDPRPFNLYNPVYYGQQPLELLPYDTTRQIQAGIYAQDQMRIGPWIIVAGIRHDDLKSKVENGQEQSNSATTGRVGVMYEFPSGFTPYYNYAQSFNPIFGANICEGGFCKPKQGESHEVGFKYNPFKGLAINGAVFDIVERNREAYGDGFLAKQIGKVGIKGAEIEVIGTIANDLDIIASYSYTDAVVLQGDNAGHRLETVPANMASLWAKQKFSLFGISGFSVGGGVRYIGETWDGIDVLRTPGYVLYDAMLAWEDKNWRFQINGTNLGDKIYVATCLARGDCFYGTRRQILSTLTYKF